MPNPEADLAPDPDLQWITIIVCTPMSLENQFINVWVPVNPDMILLGTNLRPKLKLMQRTMIVFWIVKSLKVEDRKSNLGKSIRNMCLKGGTILNMITGKATSLVMEVVEAIIEVEDAVEAVEAVVLIIIIFTNVRLVFFEALLFF